MRERARQTKTGKEMEGELEGERVGRRAREIKELEKEN